MGRLQHLERLALGRSPFQDADLGPQGCPDVVETREHDQHSLSRNGPQYDSKGRPVNPAAEERDQAMRNAQNAVLSLVGVVESTDALSREVEAASRQVQHLKARLLNAEQDRGEDFDLLATLLHTAFTWWPKTLTSKVQAGLSDGSLSLANLFWNEIHVARVGGGRGLVNMLFQGLPAWVLFNVLKALLGAGIGEGIGQLQQLLNKRMSRRSMKQVNSLIKLICEVIPIGIDAIFLPLQYIAFSQSLGLVSAWPPLSSWRLLLPWNMSRLQSLIWTPIYRSSALATFTSPGVIMLLKNFLERDQGDGLPIAQQFTTFEWPAINAPNEVVQRLRTKLRRDPLGKVLFQCYLARATIMRWLGWDLECIIEHPEPENKHQNNHIFPPRPFSSQEAETAFPARYRSTSLAQQPAQYLSDRIDDFFTRILMLPLDSLVVRSITQSHLLSGLPQSISRAIKVVPQGYLPFGGGPFSSIRAFGFSGATWQEVRDYAEKLGFSLALTHVSEVAVFFIVYRLCRWQGVETFDWGDGAKSRQRRITNAAEASSDTAPRTAVAVSDAAPVLTQ